jgi:hypothetical protein
MARKPSHFGSNIHAAPSGIPVDSFASIGSIGGWNGKASFTPARYTDRVRAVLVIAMLAGTASADDLCRRTAKGPMLDLDVKDADLQDVFRLLADTANINLVVSDEVTGKVTLKLKRVRWEQVACSLAKLHHLVLDVEHDVLMVTVSR